jgi:arylsulfatase
MKKPNILLIMADQFRFDALGCMGNPAIETPTLDWLAAGGTLFTKAYSPSPSCIPARASLMTGLNPWHTGILGMGQGQHEMGVNFPHTLPGELSKIGYYCKGIGKMHFYPQRSLLGFHDTLLDESGREFDRDFKSDYKAWFEQNRPGETGLLEHGIHWNSWSSHPYPYEEFLHPTNWTANETVKYLKKRDRSLPFFLKMSFARPHSPYDPPQSYFDLYKDKKLPEPYIGPWSERHNKEQGVSPTAWRGEVPPEVNHRSRAAYYGSVTHIDQQIAKVTNELSAQGELNNTIIVFTSDHGDMLGDHNLWRKTYAYEGSAHIPLLINCPPAYRKNKQTAISDMPVLLQDIMPTLLELAGAPIPKGTDAHSLAPLLWDDRDSAYEGPDFIHGEHCACYALEQEMQYVTDGKCKYIWFPRTNEEQFFDLVKDQEERNDLCLENPQDQRIGQWRNKLISVLEKRGCGLVHKGKLIPRGPDDPLVSPHYQKRLDESEFKWL